MTRALSNHTRRGRSDVRGPASVWGPLACISARHRVALWVGLVAAVLAGTEGVLAQYPRTYSAIDQYNTAGQERQTTFLRLPGLSADYRLGPGDQIEVTIVGLKRDPETYTIDNAGEIVIPPMGSIKMAELTAEEAEAAIAARLKSMQLLENPEVLIFISMYSAKPVYAVGELDRPGQYFMSQQWTLVDLIFVAGGIDPLATRYAYLHRRPEDAGPPANPAVLLGNPDQALPGADVVKVDLQPMMEGGVLAVNPILRKGDVLVVPRIETAMYCVLGEVMSPGVFEVPQRTTVKVSHAVLWAGGPAKTANPDKGVLVRYTASGTRQELPVDFSAILDGKSADFEVHPNDIIFIPGSTFKSVTQGALTQIPRVLNARLFFRW